MFSPKRRVIKADGICRLFLFTQRLYYSRNLALVVFVSDIFMM